MRGRTTDITQRRRSGVEDILSNIGATPAEREAVRESAAMMLEWEAWAADIRGTNDKYMGTTGEAVLDRVCADPRRWTALATAAIYTAEELRGRPAGTYREMQRKRRCA